MANRKKTTSTTKPSGLAISRSGHVFTIKWKISDKNYGAGQILQVNYNGYGWDDVPIGNSTTKKSIDFTSMTTINKKVTAGYIQNRYNERRQKGTNPYLPNIKSISFRVRGRRKSYDKNNVTYVPDWSGYSKKVIEIKAPDPPALSATLSNDYDTVTTFKWGAKSTETKWAHNIEWQSILVENSGSDGAKAGKWNNTTAGWKTNGSASLSGSKSITESGSVVMYKSHTRWFRARTLGEHGNSDWKYTYHIYALPNQSKIKSAKTTDTNADGTNVQVRWSVAKPFKRPVDFVTLQWTMAVPTSGMGCPDTASWTKVADYKDSKDDDGATFNIDRQVGEDQALFVRVNTRHDHDPSGVTYGVPYFTGKYGYLKSPSNLVVDANPDTSMATITATNNSQVPDSFLVVRFQGSKISPYNIGIIPAGQNTVTVKCPNWSGQEISFSVKAVVGSYKVGTKSGGVSTASYTASMQSYGWYSFGGDVPVAPTNFEADPHEDLYGTARVSWKWSWQKATGIELSWADHSDAWESTDGPSTYVVSNINASAWNISGLETGIVWYIRARFVSTSNDENIYGAYTSIKEVDLSTTPLMPTLTLEPDITTIDGKVVASWAYATDDASYQANAEIAEVTVVGGVEQYSTILKADNEQHISFSPQDLEWTVGETHNLAVRVYSSSGKESEWSATNSLTVADPLPEPVITTNLVEEQIEEDEETRTALSLKSMPLEVTVVGAGENGTTIVNVVRADDYHVIRPDESEFNGFEGETIATVVQTGEETIKIDKDNGLVGYLDDTAKYSIQVVIMDSLGQTAKNSIDVFEVHWQQQAKMPPETCSAEIDEEHGVAILTPIAPEDLGEGDVCDIYRLSVDKPEIVYRGAQFGTLEEPKKYVDPYPTIGESGGYRFVYRTINDDFITDQDQLAWIDIDINYESLYNMFNFGNARADLMYNVDLSNSWRKDFQETQYLGGSIQGDWNPAVSRSGSVSSVVVTADDQETIKAMRRLAVYPGICHIRTVDGSNFHGDVQVSESRGHEPSDLTTNFSLNITRVDQTEPDGMTYEQWIEHQGE